MLNPENYLSKYHDLLLNDDAIRILMKVGEILFEARAVKKRIFLAGNGASSAISSHAALDLTKQGKLTAFALNDPALVSAYSNDYGFDNAQTEIFKSYGTNSDILLLVSTSGNSPNIVNLARFGRKNGNTIISFTGKSRDNKLRQESDFSLWVDSHAYNIVENVHMIWLGYLIDSLVGKEVYAVS